MRQEFAVFWLSSSGSPIINPSELSDWLLGTKCSQPDAITPSRKDNEESFSQAEQAAFNRLTDLATAKLLPDGIQWVSGAWASEG